MFVIAEFMYEEWMVREAEAQPTTAAVNVVVQDCSNMETLRSLSLSLYFSKHSSAKQRKARARFGGASPRPAPRA